MAYHIQCTKVPTPSISFLTSSFIVFLPLLMSSQEVAERIKQTAKEYSIYLKRMLSDCGLGINLISHLAKGQAITYLNLAKIADYLDVSVDYLLGRTDDPLGGVSGDLTEDVIIYSRDGKTIKKKMSKDAMRLLTSMLDALPEDDNPDL